MKITEVQFFPLPLTLREPLTIAYHTLHEVTNVGLILHMDDGLSGVGASGPEEEVTYETFTTVSAAADSIIQPFLEGQEFVSPEHALFELAPKLIDQPAALAMVDIALYDYASKKAGVPLYTYLGAKRSELQTAITIYIHPPEETLARARSWLEKGFKILKIKGGLAVQDDITRIQLLRRELSPEIPLIFDANQGYSYDDAKKFARAVADLNITCIEQPIHKTLLEDLGRLARETPVPIMADESLRTLQDAEFLAQQGIQYFNIKLMKSGGIRESTNISRIARENGVKVIVSCMDECALANAAGLHFSLAEDTVSFVDLDSFTDYAVDPTRPAVHFDNGTLRANHTPGLGYNYPQDLF